MYEDKHDSGGGWPPGGGQKGGREDGGLGRVGIVPTIGHLSQ